MINCNVIRVDEKISSIKINGHAEFAEFGSDIVCAGVSMLVFTIGNKITMLSPAFDLSVSDNEFTFINNDNNHDVNLLLDTLYLGLKMIEEQYDEYISIKEV